MENIRIDTSHWSDWQDFYAAVLAAIGAPVWHGKNANALMESMVWGDINNLEPPYKIIFFSTGQMPPGIKENLYWMKSNLEEARDDHRSTRGYDVDVSIEIED